MLLGKKTQYQLIWLRGIAIFFQMFVLAIAELFLGISLPITEMLMLIVLYFVLHIFIYWQYQQTRPLTAQVLFSHLNLDVLILCGLLYYAGGATNPFISLLLFPLTLTATVLAASYTWVMAIIVVIAYSILMRFHISLPYNHAGGNEFSLHIWGMWFGFLLSAALVSFFIVAMRKTLKHKENLLHQASEQALRDKQLISLATLSASTAHEFGTPLATIALLCDELDAEITQPNLRDELVLPLKLQVTRCKEILSVLSDATGGVHLQGGEKLPIDQFIKNLVTDWQAGHLNIQLKVDYQGVQPAPDILAERILHQAIVNILDNAAKVSQSDIRCFLSWDNNNISFIINDSGPGLTAEQLELLGKQPISSEQFPKDGLAAKDGMGLGSFLSYTIIERMGGRIKLSNREAGGLSIQIILPIDFN
ncbi:MAG: ATP-binding protein [Pseudomonadota bacterium]